MKEDWKFGDLVSNSRAGLYGIVITVVGEWRYKPEPEYEGRTEQLVMITRNDEYRPASEWLPGTLHLVYWDKE